jgi:catechol 2,3-dioxygenase-like lactoylglutathione lyase family enzyme
MPVVVDDNSKFTVETGIYVSNGARSLEFFQGVLGFEVFGTFDLGDRFAWALRLGNSCIKLIDYEEEFSAKNPEGKAIGIRYLTIHASELEKIHQTCVESGVEIISPPTVLDEIPGKFAGCEFMLVLDPDGNRVEICKGSPWIEA